MPTEPPESEPRLQAADPPFDPVRERQRILAEVRGKTLVAHQAEMVCAALAWLAEMETE